MLWILFLLFFFLSAHRIPPSIPPTFALYYPEIICFGLETACWKEGPCTGVTDSGIERGNVQVSLVWWKHIVFTCIHTHTHTYSMHIQRACSRQTKTNVNAVQNPFPHINSHKLTRLLNQPWLRPPCCWWTCQICSSGMLPALAALGRMLLEMYAHHNWRLAMCTSVCSTASSHCEGTITHTLLADWL